MDPGVTEGSPVPETIMVNYHPPVCLAPAVTAPPPRPRTIADSGCPVNICRRRHLLCKFEREAKRNQSWGRVPRSSEKQTPPGRQGPQQRPLALSWQVSLATTTEVI